MLIYTLILFCLLFVSFRYIKVLQLPDVNSWLPSIGFAIKVIFGYYFIYIYSDVYGSGTLSADAGAFVGESKVINAIFYQSPKDYFQLLFGVGDQVKLSAQYLTETHHWDAGEQAILSDNRNILRLQSLIHFISFGSASIHMLVMCFVSMIGVRQLYLGVRTKTELSSGITFLLLLLIPSVLFWGSGILKEPFMLLGFGLFVRGILGVEKGLKKIVLLIFGAFLLIAFKPYIFMCMIPALLFYKFYQKLPKYKLIGSSLMLILIIAIPLIVFKSTTQKAVELLTRKQFDFNNVAKGGLHVNNDSIFYFFRPEQMNQVVYKGDSIRIDKPMDILILQHGSMDKPIPIRVEPSEKYYAIHFKNVQSDGYIPVTLINDSFLQLIYNIPEALINVLIRPYFNDPGSWLKYPASIELILIYGFLIFSLFYRRKLNVEDKGLIYSIVIFIFLLALTIGWVTPVLGAIVRYRIPILIGLITIGLVLAKSKDNLKH